MRICGGHKRAKPCRVCSKLANRVCPGLEQERLAATALTVEHYEHGDWKIGGKRDTEGCPHVNTDAGRPDVDRLLLVRKIGAPARRP